MIDRVLPVAVEAERAVLGAALLDALRVMPLATARFGITGDAFGVPAHGVLFGALCEMAEAGKLAGVDTLTVRQWLEDRGRLKAAGGQELLLEVLDETVTAGHAEHYLGILREKWLKRRAIEVLRRAELDAFAAENGEAFVRELPSRMASVALADEQFEADNGAVLEVELKRWEAAAAGEGPAIGLPTPFERLTQLMCGVEEGLTIIAGRPSAGKSTLEDMLSVGLALSGVPVARVQLDMNRRKSLARAVCRLGGVSLPKLKFGYARRDQLAKVREAAATVAGLPMYLNETDYGLRRICSWARAMKLKHDIRLLTVDHMQLVQVDDYRGSDNGKVGVVSSTLKALGAELGIPVVGLSQLSRGMAREARRPRLDDLRDSGTLEQDAAKVVFVYPEYRAKLLGELETSARRPVWIELSKNQDGETGLIPFWLWKKYFRFEVCQASDHEEDVRVAGQMQDDDDLEVEA